MEKKLPKGRSLEITEYHKSRPISARALILLLVVFTLICLPFFRGTYATAYYSGSGTPLSVFFNDNIYEFRNCLISNDNTVFFEADEFSRLTNVKHSIDERYQSVSIELNGLAGNFLIRSSSSPASSTQSRQVLPEMIEDRLYIPLSFFEYFYNYVIKYSKDDNIIMLFPGDKITASDLSRYVDLGNDFSIILPDDIMLKTGSSDYNYKGGLLNISSLSGSYTASIDCERLDPLSIAMMRNYFNDYTSSDEVIFAKIGEYKKSYYSAVNSFYRLEYLYGPGASSGEQSSSSSQTSVSGILAQPDPGITESSPATAIDISSQAGSLGSVFRTYTNTQIELFGVSCHLLIYNLADFSTGTDQNEHTYVVITIPSYSNKTFYNIEFKIPKGRLVPDTIYSLNRLVKSMIVSTLPLQKTDPGILSDPLIVIPAAAGVFPDLSNSSLSYVTLIDNRQGLSIDLPESAVPYHMNSLAENYNYRSYRLSKTAFISVTIMPAHNTAAEKIDLLRKLYSGRLTINEMSDKTVSGNIFSYLHYELSSSPEISSEDNIGLLQSGTLGAPSPAATGLVSSGPGKTTVYDYYINSRDSLINIRLTSENAQPSASEKQVFEKVVSSLNFIPVVSDDGTYSPSSYRSLSALQGFTGGYDLLIPSGWDAVPLTSNSSGSAYTINSDSFTASTEVVVFESEIVQDIPVSSVRSYLSGPATRPRHDLLRDYRSPLAGKNAVLLDTMAYQISSLHYIVKLTGFIDDSGRSRLAYTMDIIRNNKVSTLFISVNDYAAEASGGSPENGILRHSLYSIINSFDAAYAPGDPDSGSDKSTLEESADKFIKSQFGINSGISSFYASRTIPGEVYINVANTGSSSTSGFYRLKITSDGQVRIVSMMSIKDAVGNAVAEITERYRNFEISGITYNVTEAGSISLEMIFRKDGLYEKRLYSVNIDLTGSAPKTVIIRRASYDSLIESCRAYAENYTSSGENPEMVSGTPGWLAEGGNSGEVIKSSDGNASYIVMYIDCAEATGYFIFSVNETERSVLSSKFYDFEGIHSSLREKYDLTQGFTFLNCYPEVTDRSKITAHYLYSQDNSLQLRIDTYGLSFNADKAIMDFYLLP